jgi:excisionase family DNA binding protein
MEKLLKIKDVSAIFGIPEGTLRNWVYQKRIPYIKLGGHLRFKISDLEKYVNMNTMHIEEDNGCQTKNMDYIKRYH